MELSLTWSVVSYNSSALGPHYDITVGFLFCLLQISWEYDTDDQISSQMTSSYTRHQPALLHDTQDWPDWLLS